MAKFVGKKAKKAISAKKTERRTPGQSKTAEYVGCLLELHKLQGVLLTDLQKETRSKQR